MNEAASHAAAPDAADRTRAFLWITVAYLAAMVAALVTGIVCGERHPIAVAFAADVAATLAIFAFSFAFGNSSFYDAYWSVAPPLVALWFVVAPARKASPRGSASSSRWSCSGRCASLNWARGWSGLDHEDWRYVDLRRKAGRIGYWFVSLFGLHGMPTAIVFLGVLPLWPALASGTRPLGWLDGVAAAVTLAGVGFEFFATTRCAASALEPAVRRDPRTRPVGVVAQPELSRRDALLVRARALLVRRRGLRVVGVARCAGDGGDVPPAPASR